MIVRNWYGYTNEANAGAYVAHLESEVLPELQGIAGFRCAYVMRRAATLDDGQAGYEFFVQTAWDSYDAIRAFAGESIDVAVVPEAARALLARFDESVAHHEVVATAGID